MTTRVARTSRLLPALVLALSPLGATGCAPLAAEIPRAATPGVIQGALQGMDDPENKRRLQHLLASPEVKVIQRELVGDLLDGSLAAIGERERVERAGEVTARYAASLLRGFSRDVAPQLAGVTSATMRGMTSAMMTEENQRQMARVVGSVAQASLDPLVHSLSEAELSSMLSTAMTRDLGPAVQQVLRDNLGPGLAEALSSKEVKRALGDTAHALGRELVLGVNEGLATVHEGKETEGSSLLGSLSHLAHQGATVGKVLPWILAAVTLLLAGWVIRLLGQTRRYRTETEHRADTTRVLTEALLAAEGKPWSGELLTALEDRFHADEEALLRIRAARLGRRGPQTA